LSYTALAIYERCPLRFRAQRVLGLPDVPAPSSPAFGFGEDRGATPPPPGLEAREGGVLAHALLEAPDLAAGTPPAPQRLAAPAADIARGDFAPTDRPHIQLCATCPARERLCPHPAELKLRPRPPR